MGRQERRGWGRESASAQAKGLSSRRGNNNPGDDDLLPRLVASVRRGIPPVLPNDYVQTQPQAPAAETKRGRCRCVVCFGPSFFVWSSLNPLPWWVIRGLKSRALTRRSRNTHRWRKRGLRGSCVMRCLCDTAPTLAPPPPQKKGNELVAWAQGLPLKRGGGRARAPTVTVGCAPTAPFQIQLPLCARHLLPPNRFPNRGPAAPPPPVAPHPVKPARCTPWGWGKFACAWGGSRLSPEGAGGGGFGKWTPVTGPMYGPHCLLFCFDQGVP